MHTTYDVPAVGPLPSLGIGAGLAAPLAADCWERRHTVIDGITYKIADCLSEREAAFRLVYDAYKQTGLAEPNPYGMRVTPYHLLSTTDVFLAVHEGQVIHTMTLVRDGQLGLPMETLYPNEVASRRDSGVQLAEGSCFAACQGRFSQSFMFKALVQLQAMLAQSARANGADRLVLAVHPRHAKIYKRLLGFDQIGQEQLYASVLDNPAVAIEHDFARLDELRYPLYENIYGVLFAPWELAPRPMSEDERQYCAPIAEQCDPCLPIGAA